MKVTIQVEGEMWDKPDADVTVTSRTLERNYEEPIDQYIGRLIDEAAERIKAVYS